MNVPRPPDHLSDEMKRWWRLVTRRYALQSQHYQILQVACESWDRLQQARVVLAKDGITVTTRHGEKRVHPCVPIERDAKTSFLPATRELALADSDVPGESRPPRPAGRYQGRP